MAVEREESDGELIRRLARPRLAVGGRDVSWPLYAGIAGLALLGLIVFLSLSQQRARRQQAVAPPPAAAAAPVPVPVATLPPPPPPVILPPPVAVAPLAPPPAAAPSQAAIDAAARLRAPAMIVDLGRAVGGGPAEALSAAAAATPAKPDGPAAAAAAAPGAKPATDEQFAARVASGRVDTVEATQLASTGTVAPQGTIIPAVLETGLSSDLPGYVRAVVSRDVRGFDGSIVLIPRGTKLIGEYKSGVAAGQSRAFVVWSRLLTPGGVSVDIGSPAVDTLGRGGIQGEANSHFLRRFGAAILLSVLSAGLEAGVNHFSPNNSTVVIGTPQQATNVAAIALQRDIDVPTTIVVPQGTPIRVFVARDLDFSSVASPGR